jgi:tripartite-type tricarboxylate transporter receptor subunit TctC
MRTLVWAIALLVSASSACYGSETYPNRPVRWVVPLAPGGSTDMISRVIAQGLTESWRTQVVVENRPGSGGTIGLANVAKSAADGYTVALAQLSNVALAPAFYRQLSYDPIKDFSPITLVSKTPMIVVAHPSMGVRSLQELIALARSKPNSITFGSAGNGSIGHLAAEMLKHMSRIQMIHVPYKGGSQAITDLIGGQISLGVIAIPTALPLINDHRLVALGVTSGKRSPVIPDVPTVAESGLAGYAVENWYGVMAPVGTPREIVTRIQEDVVKVLARQTVRSRLVNDGGEVIGSTAGEFATFIRSEIAKWTTVIRESGAKVD